MQHRESPERPRLDSAQPAGSRFQQAAAPGQTQTWDTQRCSHHTRWSDSTPARPGWITAPCVYWKARHSRKTELVHLSKLSRFN